VPGQYSLKVEDTDLVQQLIDLDAGETAETGITSLTDVQGTNTITASASTTITAYVDKEIYIFTLANAPTGAVTLNIDSVGAKSIVKDGAEPIVEGDGLANQIWAVAFNSTNDNLELQSDTSNVVNFYEGTPVVSAATTDIWATDGNTIHITGTTACTSFGTAPNVGARRRLIYDGVVTLTNSANLNLQGGADFTTEAGDILEVYADTTTQFDVIIHKVDGKTIVVATQTEANAGTDDTLVITPLTLKNLALGQSLATNGFATLPGGLILQWGTSGSIANNCNITVTLPLTFPNNFLNLQATRNENTVTSGAEGAINATITSLSQLRLNNSASGTANAVFWAAIGN